MYWKLYRASTSCCQDCDGVIYPSGEVGIPFLHLSIAQVVSTRNLGDACDTEEKAVCKHNDGEMQARRYQCLLQRGADTWA